MKMRRWTIAVLFFPFLGMAHGVFGQDVTDKSQVAFHKDDTGYVFLASGVNLRNYDTVVIGNFSIEGLTDLGPGKLESYRDSYRTQLKTKMRAAVIFKEVTDDQLKASGPNTLVLWGDFIAMHPGSTAARMLAGITGAGKAVAEIKTYMSKADDKRILLAHHLRPTSGMRGGYGNEALAWLYLGVDRISTSCVEYIKRVHRMGR